VDVLLDLDDGSLVASSRTKRIAAPAYAAGSVTGPVAVVVQMYSRNGSVRLLPAQQPHPSKPIPEASLSPQLPQ
jgi:hypothetical protein